MHQKGSDLKAVVCLLQHEVLAITEKVVLRVEDLLTWITEAADWSWGLSAVYNQNTKLMPRPSLLSDNSAIDLSEVDQEKEGLGRSEYLYVPINQTLLQWTVEEDESFTNWTEQ